MLPLVALMLSAVRGSLHRMPYAAPPRALHFSDAPAAAAADQLSPVAQGQTPL